MSLLEPYDRLPITFAARVNGPLNRQTYPRPHPFRRRRTVL
jgi:hypothetical protein